MSNNSVLLGKLAVERKTGYELFDYGLTPLNSGAPSPSLLSFWQWSSSDLVSNTMRGILAEYIIACDFSVTENLRTEWDNYDLKTQCGITVEVKSAAYIQSWCQCKYSTISFGIAPTSGWNNETCKRDTQIRRQADVYVFALLSHKEQATVDPLNLKQWDFYVLATSVLNREKPTQKRINLSALKALNPQYVQYGEIKNAVINAVS